MTDQLHEIALASADLKRANPEVFQRFVNALSAFEVRCIADLIAADPGTIVGMQGRAQVVGQLRKKIEDCFEIQKQSESRR